MSTRRVYVDACVLISAWKGEGELSDSALAAIEEDNSLLLYSSAVELEVLPKANFFGKLDEVEFYTLIFANSERVVCDEAVHNLALIEGSKNGLNAVDALHVACAVIGKADELLTLEKKTRLPAAPNLPVPVRTLRTRLSAK